MVKEVATMIETDEKSQRIKRLALSILIILFILAVGGLLWAIIQEMLLMFRIGVNASSLANIYINTLLIAIMIIFFAVLIFVLRRNLKSFRRIFVYDEVVRGLKLLSLLLILASLYPFFYIYDAVRSAVTVSEIIPKLLASPAFLVCGIILYIIFKREKSKIG